MLNRQTQPEMTNYMILYKHIIDKNMSQIQILIKIKN